MEDLYLRIEDYLDGLLPEAERAAFEAALQHDEALAEAFQLVSEARRRLRPDAQAGAREQALKQTLAELKGKYFEAQAPSAERPKRKFNIWLPAVAAALGLLGFVWWWLRPPLSERLYADYRSFPEAAFTNRAQNSPLGNAESAFNQKDYAAAAAALQTWLQESPDDTEARFFYGLALLEQGKSENARQVFSALFNPPNAWTPELQWYTALSFLRENRILECKAVLQNINPGKPHFDTAQQLLKALP
jgi:anti-sigma factor RsiW